MANLAAQAQARTNSLSLCTDDGELDALCVDVLHRRADWDAMRDWFAARLKTQQP